ncbi:MAG: sulfatase [Candidatus Omnitrophica bacterium]|nr:sulfatase [Candidatus Omnitrophota bacterium]
MRSLKICLIFVLIPILFFVARAFWSIKSRNMIKPGIFAGYNVILVSFDALQAAHLGCLGYPRKITPTIDKFAKEGFLFKNAVSQSSWTVPSTMSYFTSLYPSQHKLINKYSTYTEKEKTLSNLKKLSPGVLTLAEVLKENGYATGGFTGDAGVGACFGFAEGFDEYFEGPKFGGMDRSAPAALEWLKKNHARKFFVFLHGYDVHGQFDPPGGFTREFVDPPYTGRFKGTKEEQAAIREEGLGKGSVYLTNEDVRFWRAFYDEKIKDVDERFRSFIKELKKMGVLDKTIFILFSDHGTEFYEHKRFDHGFSLYEELIHVPLIIWLPNLKAGVKISDQVRAIDVMPTLLDLLGVKIPEQLRKQIQGVSLLSLMQGKHMNLTAYSETDYRFYAHKRSIRTPEGLKFIYSMDTESRELYDLNKDPGELNNLIEKDKRTAYELEQKLFSWLKSMGQDENYYIKLFKGLLKIKEF